MERRRENAGWQSVPQFGAWDQKGAASPNYSMVFSQARAKRKQAKKTFRHWSLGNESDLLARQANHGQHHYYDRSQYSRHHSDHEEDDSIARKKTFLTYVNCCIRP